MTRLLVALIAVGLAASSAQPTKRKSAPTGEHKMMSRVLTDADIDLYCVIAAEIRKLTGPVRSGADSDRMFEITKSTAPKHGLTHGEYRSLDLRISAALLTLDTVQKDAIAAKMKADCDLVAKHRARIEIARKFAK